MEAFYSRGNGKQQTVVVSFAGKAEAKDLVGRRSINGSRVKFERAYSSRSTPNQDRRLKTWWRSGVVGGCVLGDVRAWEVIRWVIAAPGSDDWSDGKSKTWE